MTDKYTFQFLKMTTDLSEGRVAKDAIIRAFSLSAGFDSSLQVHINFTPLEDRKFFVKSIKINHAMPEFLMGLFGLQSHDTYDLALRLLAKKLNKEPHEQTITSARWLSFSDQFSDWYETFMEPILEHEVKTYKLCFHPKTEES